MASVALDGGTTTEEPCVRSFFYVGGYYADDGKGGHVVRDQMYAEKLLPVRGASQDLPIILIHSQGQTGTVSPRSFPPSHSLTHNQS
jgi:hypothetical protein